MKTLLLIAGTVTVLTATAVAQPADQLKKTAHDAYAALSNHDIDKFSTYIADNAVDYGQGPQPLQGKAAIMASLKDFFSAFPDYTVSVEGIAVDGNKVYVQNTFKGTHRGTLAGMIPATNKPVVWRDVDIVEFDKSGKMMTHWVNNPNAILEQIGLLAYANPNTAVVLQGYERFGKGDVTVITAACTDDVVWTVAENPVPNLARVYRGRQELGTFFKNLSTGLQITKFEPYRFFADGDDVIAFVNTEYKLTGDSKSYRTTLIHHFVIRNGMIASFREVMDKPQELSVATK